ncbi:type IV toxin-antitoxin system AbiEi family antitoxin domain-containing protein [Devriesea agamarum]|uniref:type IV toxin-antitoxin system AbiEi family antitoxin domain-containing protein n=1 Tax=Devriesea agamarum TaxID=472569 RepID=UPI00071DB1A3|nr:type IV toxin-antitoxin system AbiEi family antitoxin domain-containing protein [Devriesea agamarum]
MRSVDVITTLEELGSSQWGLVTTGQAEEYGISRVTMGRLRDDAIISPVRRGVWALPSADHGPLQDLKAAWLSTNSKALGGERLNPCDVVVSFVSAATVHGLGNLIPQQHEFTAPKRRQTIQSDLRFHRADVTGDVVIVHGLPVTSIPRTVADLAATSIDFDHLGTIISDALAFPDVRPRDLAARLDPYAGRYGYANGALLVEASLEVVGLPAVAMNLSATRALAKAFASQSSINLASGLDEAIARQLKKSGLVERLAHLIGEAFNQHGSPFQSSSDAVQGPLKGKLPKIQLGIFEDPSVQHSDRARSHNHDEADMEE